MLTQQKFPDRNLGILWEYACPHLDLEEANMYIIQINLKPTDILFASKSHNIQISYYLKICRKQ